MYGAIKNMERDLIQMRLFKDLLITLEAHLDLALKNILRSTLED